MVDSLNSSLHACFLLDELIYEEGKPCRCLNIWVTEMKPYLSKSRVCSKVCFNFNHVMSMCLYVCMYVHVCASHQEFRLLYLSIAGITGSCQKLDRAPGNELVLTAQPGL